MNFVLAIYLFLALRMLVRQRSRWAQEGSLYGGQVIEVGAKKTESG